MNDKTKKRAGAVDDPGATERPATKRQYVTPTISVERISNLIMGGSGAGGDFYGPGTEA